MKRGRILLMVLLVLACVIGGCKGSGKQGSEGGNTQGGKQGNESGDTEGGKQGDEIGDTEDGKQGDEIGDTEDGKQGDESGDTEDGKQGDEIGDTEGDKQDSSTPRITPEVSIPSPEACVIPDIIVDTTAEVYTYETCCKDLLFLERAYPELIKLTFEGYSVDMRPIPMVVFGNLKAEKTVFIQAAIHGREHMTAQLVMKQLEEYAKNYETGSFGGKTYREIFDEVNLWIVPMSNPDGVSISQIGPSAIRNEALRTSIEQIYEASGSNDRSYFFKRWKANANGVDLNRNFAYGWEDYVGVSAPAGDHYKGTAPGSEPESALLMQLTKAAPVVAALSYHATGSILYWDFGQQGELRRQCEQLMETVRKQTGYTTAYAATDKQDEAGYCEWAVGIEGIPEVTIEIGTVAAPLPISEFPRVFEKNRLVPAAVALMYYEQ